MYLITGLLQGREFEKVNEFKTGQGNSGNVQGFKISQEKSGNGT